MTTYNFVLISVTIPIIATGLLVWAKLRKMILLLEEIKSSCRPGQS